MDSTEKSINLMSTICLIALCCYKSAAYAGSEIYQCRSADGSIEINDKGCRDGTLERHYGSQKLKELSSSNKIKRSQQRAVNSPKSPGSKNRKRYLPGYASKATLKKKCGSQFDGVNATNLDGLKRSLKIRESEKRMFRVDSKEISELKCRIKRLEKL